MFKILKNTPTLRIILVAISIFCLYQFLLYNFSFFQFVNLKYQDIFAHISYHLKRPPPEISDIVILKIDDESIRMINQKIPWPRSLISEVIGRVNLYQPKVLVLDLLLLGRSSDLADDLALLKEFERSKNVILGSYFDEKGNYNLPNEIFREKVSAWGFVNRPRDSDLSMRSTRLVRSFTRDRVIDYSLSLKTAALYLDCPLSEIKFVGREIILPTKAKGIIKISIAKNGTIPVNFMGALDRFQSVSFWRLLQEDFPSDFFKDKIVLVGATSEVFHDVYASPIGLMSGVVFLANDTLTLISQKFVKSLPWEFNLIILLLICVLGSYLGFRFSLYRSLIFSLFLIILSFFLSLILSFKNYRGDFFGPVFMLASTFLVTNSYKYLSLIIESAHLKVMAVTDGLTGLYVYRYFSLSLQSEFSKAIQENRNLSLVIMDIDHFKNLNDTYGHEQGNAILKSLAALLQQSCRKTDIVCRYGGEEFVVILKDTNQKEAVTFAEKIRHIVADYDFPTAKGTMRISLSFGVCGLGESKAKSPEDLIKCADACLYQAKMEGRNRVCFYVETNQ